MTQRSSWSGPNKLAESMSKACGQALQALAVDTEHKLAPSSTDSAVHKFLPVAYGSESIMLNSLAKVGGRWTL